MGRAFAGERPHQPCGEARLAEHFGDPFAHRLVARDMRPYIEHAGAWSVSSSSLFSAILAILAASNNAHDLAHGRHNLGGPPPDLGDFFSAAGSFAFRFHSKISNAQPCGFRKATEPHLNEQ